MSHPKPTPDSIRKIRAKLRNYTRPFVWGSVLLLGLLTILIWEFSENPERFYLFSLDDQEDEDIANQPEGWMRISAEDSGIAADIDSSSVLLSELNQMQPPPELTLPTSTQANRRSPSSRSQPNPTPSASNPGLDTGAAPDSNWEDLYQLPELSILPSLENPSSSDLPQLTVSGIPTGSGNGLGISSSPLNNFETPEMTRLPVSPLQSAMDRLYAPNPSTSGDRNSDQTAEAQGSESTPQSESNRGNSSGNRPNAAQTSGNPSGNSPQSAQTSNGNPQNNGLNPANPYGNPPQPTTPYGTPLNSPSPYSNTTQPVPTLEGTPQNSPNPYLVQESNPNLGSPTQNQPVLPQLPGEISPDYGMDYTQNNYQPLPSIPLTPDSSPTNAYDYLLRSGGESVPLVPPAPPAVPLAPNNLLMPSSQTPNSSIYESPRNDSSVIPSEGFPGVQPLNQPSDRFNSSNLNPSLNQPNNFPTSQPVTPPSVQSPPLDNSGLNLNPRTPELQPIQPIQPFSVPNPTPGRHIGGGNINTFSNP
jgi:hypothetical protein